jgi:hypothetical protein
MRLPLRVLRNGLGVCYHGLLFMPFLIEDVEHGALIVDLSLRYVDWVLFVLHRTIAHVRQHDGTIMDISSTWPSNYSLRRIPASEAV